MSDLADTPERIDPEHELWPVIRGWAIATQVLVEMGATPEQADRGAKAIFARLAAETPCIMLTSFSGATT